MTLRLETVAPDLVTSLAQADITAQRRVALAAAELAADRTGIGGAEVDRAFAALRGGLFGASAERSGVQALTERLDEQQWAIQERLDAGQATTAEHLAAFSTARAASALYFALDADPRTAALETVYEAHAAIDDLDALRDLVTDRLDE